MKKSLLLKSLLLLCALVVGSGTMWATDETIDFTAQGYTNGETVSSTTGTVVTATFTDGGNATAYYDTGTAVRVYNGGTMTITAGGLTITQIVYTYELNGSATATVAGSTNAGTWNSGTRTWTGSDTEVVLTAGTAKHVRISAVTVTYTPATKTNPTITFNNGSVNAGRTLDVSTLFSSNSDGAVTYSITAGGSYATISGTTLTGVAAGSVTVKAEQAATALYNAGEASATITVNAAPALSSIAITTAPTKTTYKEGQTFDPTGMVVTATFADDSEEDVTASCTWTPSGALSTSDAKVTISYTENAVTKTADQAITVTAQSADITINTNYTWLGVSSGGSLSSFPKVIDCDGLTVTISGEGTKTRGDATYIRLYAKNSLKFTAPANHFIKSIEFTVYNSNWTNSFNVSGGGSWDNTNKIWSCGDDFVTEVTLTEAGASGNNQISQIEVTLVPYTTITPGKTYTTLTSAKNLDFTKVSSALKAYIATAVAAGKVQMVQVNKVPAGTGLVLMATTPGSAVNVPVFDGTSPSDVSGNKLAGSATSTTAIAADGGYILKDGVFQPALAGTLAAGKAYLNIAVSARELELSFDENDVTAISELTTTNCTNNTNEYFDLQGRKVAQPTKGLYIVNGKKVMVK